ncbi:MAG: DNA polymerase/3'-5' exonuclease PolX [Anaerolineales bacterium]|nr:DNA polymerase/3'-5' exonuclease PolX [Anaerolineales bacterium]
MNNKQLADLLENIAHLLEIKGEVIYKVLAYRKAAESLRELGQEVETIYQDGSLKEIPGVGEAISEKIKEILETGDLKYYQTLTAEVPPTLIDLLEVPGLGPKRVALFWRELGVTTLEELKTAAQAEQLQSLEGIGPKTETNVLRGLESLQHRTDRTLLGDAFPLAQRLLSFLREQPGVEDAQTGGSVRRMRETVGDLDILASAGDSQKVIEAFVKYPEVAEIVSRGEIKASVVFSSGIRAQLWVHPPEHFGTALQYATGAKDHNVRLRKEAQEQGYSLSEHALVRESDQEELHFSREEEVYQTLGLPWIPPELREDRGEIQAAREGRLPDLINREDILCELHSHTTWSDGKFSIREMAEAGVERGYQILAVTDHSRSLGIAGGLSSAELEKQLEELQAVREEMGDRIHLLSGIELEILADGSLDFPDQILAGLDLVIASLHTSMRQPREKVTRRLLNAIQNPHVDIIAHPTNRLIGKREPADLDMDAVLQAAAEHGTALEINSNPRRLDLSDVYARRAVEMGIPLTINTDAHSPLEMDYIFYGVAAARRAWVEAGDVINCWEKDRLLSWLKNRG